jgi:structure-specific endonuclease subunit SLX1
VTENKRRTYVGATKYKNRRIRQHNAEIKGGARYTSAQLKKHGKWSYKYIIHGFNTWNEALKFEWRWKHVRKKKLCKNENPIERRQKNLELLLTYKPWNTMNLKVTSF